MSLKEIYNEYLTNDISKLYKIAVSEGLDITYKDVKNFINKNKLAQITKKTTRDKKQTGLITTYPKQYYQADIIIYDNHTYQNYKHILICIDVYSRYVMALPLTNRKAKYLLIKLNEILENMGKPKTLFLDNEFNNKIFNQYFDDEDIRIIFSDPEDKNKNVYVERVNGTIRRLLQRYLLSRNTKDWIKGLDKIIKSYNKTIHSTTNKQPINLFNGKSKSEQQYNFYKEKYIIGDTIRIKSKRKVFDKGSESLLSNEIYMIEKIMGNRLEIKNIKNGNIKTISKERAVKIELPNDIDEIDNDIIDEVIEKPKKENKARKFIKREGLDENNIIEGKRKRKPIRYI